MGGLGLALVTAFLPIPSSGAWLACGLATLCGVLLAVGTLEPAAPLVDRYERELAETALALGLRGSLRSGQRAALDRIGAVSIWLCVIGLGGVAVWCEPRTVVWLTLAWPIAWLTLFIHELGHALVGRALGYRLLRISVGADWPEFACWNVGSIVIRLGVLPMHGLTEFEPASTPTWLANKRVAWAGPATGAALACLGFLAFSRAPADTLAGDVGLVLGFCGAGSLLQLSPGRVHAADRFLHTDGAWLFLPERVLRQVVCVAELARRTGSVSGQRAELLAALDSELAAAPTPESLVTTAFLIGRLAGSARDDAELEALEPLVASCIACSTSTAFKTSLLEALARHVLRSARNVSLALAERWARSALELDSNYASAYGALGAALVRQGRIEEGCSALAQLAERTTSATERRSAQRALAKL
ncbi:MAG: M50 family metallopeptidase [Polyangiaceae bacterium]